MNLEFKKTSTETVSDLLVLLSLANLLKSDIDENVKLFSSEMENHIISVDLKK
jgi:hypothetical protein